ncbi:MAG TPA: hypothetical protein VFS18_05650 [Actinomycetota bacterium]|nr:hypothetical protein [Actinomycetota bacterium]
MKRHISLALISAVVVTALPVGSTATGSPVDAPARGVEPVVLTGAQLPGWSGPQAEGIAQPYPSGAFDGVRDAHNGHLVVPPEEAQTGVAPETVAAYSWNGESFEEIPVQVDERFPYFLANANSDFGMYSGTDKELSYEWDVESWKKTAGECFSEYPEGAEAKQDPVLTLDDDDEVTFMASDAGPQAPADALGPAGSGGTRQEIRLVDPRDPASESFVYLFTTPDGSSFDETNGYVDYDRDDNADEWIDRYTFADDDPEKLGTSNTGYGPNLSGTVCDGTGTPRASEDRFPRDGVTVSTDTYQWRATGRWMVREMHVTKPGTTREYGPDLIDRWKGRAFQQSPDSTISVVGFEDEQVNWEGNSVLLGELAGPVRAIREVWGADSGTNVTKTEIFYRDAIAYRYRVRVHPIPPDGLYTSWDYNHDVAARYYNETKTEGVAIDGVNDDIANIDSNPVNGDPAFFDAPDPTFTKPLAFLNWEQVSGRDDSGSLVYIFEMKNANSLLNPAVVPYYRDDACLDDGTGDNPSPREWPGESYEWMAERGYGYVDYPCFTEAPEGYTGPYRQGAFGSHGVHYFFTHDTDNAAAPVPVTEIDGQQWQWAVPTEQPMNVGDAYANTVKTPLVPIAALQPNTAGEPEPEPTPTGTPSPTPTGSPTPEPTPTEQEQRPSEMGLTISQERSNYVATATLLDEATDAPLEGKTVRFFHEGREVSVTVTDASGHATLVLPKNAAKKGDVIEVVFEGDEAYLASSARGEIPKN